MSEIEETKTVRATVPIAASSSTQMAAVTLATGTAAVTLTYLMSVMEESPVAAVQIAVDSGAAAAAV